MNKPKNKVHFFKKIWDLEIKYKIMTYCTLVFLSLKMYNLNADYKELNLAFTHAQVQLATLKEINTSLVGNMIIFNRNYEDFPLPIWQKVKRNDKFIMQYVNPTYVNLFGFAFDYDQYAVVGKSNFDLFYKNLAQRYYENDITVSITGEPLEIIEYSKDSLGNQMKLKVLKWRSIKDKKDTLIYGMVKEVIE